MIAGVVVALETREGVPTGKEMNLVQQNLKEGEEVNEEERVQIKEHERLE